MGVVKMSENRNLFKKAGQRIVKQVRIANIFKDPDFEIPESINEVRQALETASYQLQSDEFNERQVRKSVKRAMRLVQAVVDEKTIERYSDQFRSELCETANGMVDYLSGKVPSNDDLNRKLQGTMQMLNETETSIAEEVVEEAVASSSQPVLEPDLPVDKDESIQTDILKPSIQTGIQTDFPVNNEEQSSQSEPQPRCVDCQQKIKAATKRKSRQKSKVKTKQKKKA